MTELQSSKDIFINETERKPNHYAANVLVGIVAVIAVVFVLNELYIFEMDSVLVYVCLFVAILMFILMRVIVFNPKRAIHPSSKYIMMGMVLLLVLTLTTLLNIHAILAYVLPLLLATQYRSRRVSLMALIGTLICASIAPILSYLFNTWSLVFVTGYIQTFCKVTVNITNGNNITTLEAIYKILLYWAMPQMMTILAFGLILFSTTKSGIDSVNNQMQVADLSNNLNKQLLSIKSMQEKVLFSMSDIIENRDVETGGHVKRTIEIVRLLSEAMMHDSDSNVTPEFCNNVIRSAPMHDLGKIAIPDAILQKPGKLTYEEFEIVKQHPVKSAQIILTALTGIEDDNLLNVARNIALYHHEKMDGTGYPQGLLGEEIPLEARIMAIADVYDALVSERCYKAPMSLTEAFDTIESLMGTHFDPALNKYFIACRRDIESNYLS